MKIATIAALFVLAVCYYFFLLHPYYNEGKEQRPEAKQVHRERDAPSEVRQQRSRKRFSLSRKTISNSVMQKGMQQNPDMFVSSQPGVIKMGKNWTCVQQEGGEWECESLSLE